MSLPELAAIVATLVLAVLALLQAALAAGLPLARFAWGGQYEGVLPSRLRWASVLAIPILGLAAWIILARADLVAPGSDAAVARVGAWVFAVYFVLNTVLNLLSKSRTERLVMTPASALLVACFVVVATS